MSEEDNDELAQSPSTIRKQKIARVPLQSFEDYLERMRPGRSCCFCTGGTYIPAPSPQGGTAGVVATPAPNVAKIGVWFFAATCDKCGDTRLFHAPLAYDSMMSEH